VYNIKYADEEQKKMGWIIDPNYLNDFKIKLEEKHSTFNCNDLEDIELIILHFIELNPPYIMSVDYSVSQ